MFDIVEEYQMVGRIKDIQDEVQMLLKVIDEQCQLLSKLKVHVKTDPYNFWPTNSPHGNWDAARLLERALARKDVLERLQAKAENVYRSVSHLLACSSCSALLVL